MSSLDTVQSSGIPLRNRKGPTEFMHPLDMDSAISIGIALPLTSGDQGEYPAIVSGSGASAVTPLEEKEKRLETDRKSGGVFTLNYTTKDQVQSNLRNLILTSPGERHYHPNFGCGVYELLFDNATDNVLETLEGLVDSQVQFWLPYVTLHDVNVTRAEYEPNRVNISLTYSSYNNLAKEVVDIVI